MPFVLLDNTFKYNNNGSCPGKPLTLTLKEKGVLEVKNPLLVFTLLKFTEA